MAEAPDREARRRTEFARQEGTFPLPIAIDDLSLPDGGRLAEDEFVVRTAKDWGTSVKPLLLTTRRLICPSDPSGGRVAIIPLTDVRSVTLRKHAIGFSSIVIETANQGQASFPAHINGPLMKADIAASVDFAQRAAPKLSVVNPPWSGGDRYEQLRRIGELKASGVLSDTEFEEEKARILKER
jgi:hypothetical protein